MGAITIVAVTTVVCNVKTADLDSDHDRHICATVGLAGGPVRLAVTEQS